MLDMTIGGAAAATGDRFAVLNPATGAVVATAPNATRADLDRAVAAARAAARGWAARPDAERAALSAKIAQTITAHAEELARLLTLEQGKPLNGLGSRWEMGGAAAWAGYTASLSLPPRLLQDDDAGRVELVRKPIGVVGSITPWNFPAMIAVWHFLPAIRAGNTVVLKPSPLTPLTTLRLVALLNEVLPAGVLNVVTGDDRGFNVGAAMAAHPGIDKIVFTGSINTGKKVMGGAATTLKRITLELGGNDAGIILPGTKIEPLLEKLFWGCFINAGQTCAALKRLYVHSSQYEEVVSKFADYMSKIPVGNGLDPKNLIGPLNNKMQLDKVASYVDEARARGARIVIGGVRPKGPGFFYPLTLIADVTDDMLIVKEEQFGTVVPVIKYETVDEAIARANSLNVGLGGSVWGDDAAKAAEIASRLECGTAWVNQHGGLHPMAPFGGVKCSGIGVEFNVDGLKEYTTVQVLNIAV